MLIYIINNILSFFFNFFLGHNPENVKKWDEIHRHQFSGEMRH